MARPAATRDAKAAIHPAALTFSSTRDCIATATVTSKTAARKTASVGRSHSCPAYSSCTTNLASELRGATISTASCDGARSAETAGTGRDHITGVVHVEPPSRVTSASAASACGCETISAALSSAAATTTTNAFHIKFPRTGRGSKCRGCTVAKHVSAHRFEAVAFRTGGASSARLTRGPRHTRGPRRACCSLYAGRPCGSGRTHWTSSACYAGGACWTDCT